MNRHAQALGRLARGVRKTLTPEQRRFRAQQLAEARRFRHAKRPAAGGAEQTPKHNNKPL